MLNSYLTQKASLRPALRDESGMVMDERGQAQYGDETVIPCRRQPKIKELLTPDGQTLQTTTVFFLASEVFAGDLLDGRRVMDVSAWHTLGGTVAGWRAVC